jgi:hypothetical protein
VRCRILVVEHTQQHGRHAQHVGAALRLDELEQSGGLGASGEHMDATGLQGAERCKAAPAVWNSGIGLIQTLSVPVPIARA